MRESTQYFQNRSPPVKSYKYSNTVAAKILKFNATVRNIDTDDFIKSPPSCDCASSPFRYPPHDHVITGDFTIIPNEDLKRLLLKGPNYREQTSINWGYNIKLIFTAIEDYAKKWAKKERQEYECLKEWVLHVKQMVGFKVNSLRKTVESKRHGILELNSVKECLKELQEKYVFVPADKAANKITVVYKRYYLEVTYKELGLWPGTTSSDTYILETMDPKEISGNHISCMKSLKLKEDNLSDKFSNFYWTPKLHKSPYKHRFIGSSFNCTTKPLSVLLNRTLYAIKGKLSNLLSVIYSRTGINEMWILKNSSKLLQKMNSFHYPKITSIQTFDFSTLYTSIPHQKLKDRIHMLVNQTFLYK